MTRKEDGASPLQAAPQNQSRTNRIAEISEHINRTWTFADEREVTKLLLAFRRFRIAGLNERSAVSMVKVWFDGKRGRSYVGIDMHEHPMHSEIVAYHDGGVRDD